MRAMTVIPSGTFLQKGLLSIFALFLLSGVSINSHAGIFDEGDPEAGALVFDSYCVTCHELDRAKSAPALAGVADRWGSTEEMLVMWIQSPSAARATGDEYINTMYDKYSSQYADMTAQLVSVDDIKNVMAYIQNPPVVDGVQESGCVTIHDIEIEDEGATDKWFLILGIFFIIVILSAAGVARSLKNAIRERDGKEPLANQTYWERTKGWMWNNMAFTSLLGLFATIFVLVWLYMQAMGVAVVENYEPDQPIWFSHSVHVCENDIDCEYCHHSSRKSKHAGIPTSDVCMNCHKDIQEGTKTGTEEISKIYAAIGFDPSTNSYKGAEGDTTMHFGPQDSFEGEPVVWNKVHNLPDHVYFSHAQHVEVGGLDCKNCHGPVETFTVGRVSNTELTNSQTEVTGLIELSKPTLTMGWCIECHNKANIDKSNEYYVEMHNRMSATSRGQEEMRKIMEDNQQTVKEFGGWECAKCHY